MPFVHIRIAGPIPINPEQVRRLQDEATRLMANIMRKEPELTSVLVEQVPLAGWLVGGRSASVAAHIDVKVTQGTNTAEEKGRFISSAAVLLRNVLGGNLPTATYVVVDEKAADAWGYDGLTQEHRRQGAEADRQDRVRQGSAST
jgi:4-oxalocrotonate tautomerase